MSHYPGHSRRGPFAAPALLLAAVLQFLALPVSASPVFLGSPALRDLFPYGTVVMGGRLWGPYLGATHTGDAGPGVLSFDGVRTQPGGHVKTDLLYLGPRLWTDGTRLYAEGNGTRVGLAYSGLRGQFRQGETVRQASTGATGLLVRVTPEEIVLFGQSGTFANSTGAAGQEITGQTSGAVATPAHVTASPHYTFLERSEDGYSDFTPVADFQGTAIQHSFVDCGKVASLGGKHLLLWFDYIVAGHTPGVWFNYPDEGTEWHHLFDANLGAIKHFHGGILMRGVNHGRDRLFVMTGDTDSESSILLCDDLASLVTQPSLWKHRWAMDQTGDARTAALTQGDGRPYCIGAGTQRYRAVELVHDPASGYVYYVPDSTLEGVDSLVRFAPDTGALQRVGTRRTRGSGWFGLRTTGGRILFTSVPERWGGSFQGDCDGYLRLWAVTDDGQDLTELRRWSGNGAPNVDGLWGFKNALEFAGALWLPALGADVEGGSAVGVLLDTAPTDGLELALRADSTAWPAGPPPNMVADGAFTADATPYFTAVNCRLTRQQTVGPATATRPYAGYLQPQVAVSPAFVHQALPVDELRGHWARFTADVLAPTSLPTAQVPGVLISDGSTARFLRVPTRSDNWQTLSTVVFVPETAEHLYLTLYARTGTLGGGGVYFANVSLVPGALEGTAAQATLEGTATQDGGLWTYRYTATRSGPANLRAVELPLPAAVHLSPSEVPPGWSLLGPVSQPPSAFWYTDQPPSSQIVDTSDALEQPTTLSFSFRSPSGPSQAQAALIDEAGNLVTQTVPVPSKPSVLLGDMNQDGRLTIADAVLLLRTLIAPNPPSPDVVARGDLNGDGKLTIADVVLVLRHLLGLL